MKPTKRLLLILLAVFLLLGACCGIQALTDPLDCRILEGVSVGGLDLGGLLPWQAQALLKETLEETLLSQPLTVQLPQETLTLAPEDSVMRIHPWRAVRDACRAGRREGAESQLPLLPYLTLDGEGISRILTDCAARRDTDLVQPSWVLTGDLPDLATHRYDPDAPGQTLVVTMGIPKVRMDVLKVSGEILAAYEGVISACKAGSFFVTPQVEPQILPDRLDLAPIAREVNRAAVDDSLDMSTYAFVPGAYGYGFDPEEAQRMVDNADFGQILKIPLTAAEPEIFADEVYFRDVLGHCETRHSSDENRNTNLRLLCQALDGFILEPGQELSFNEVVGQRTEERGYKAANAYSGKRMVKDIGGGVCQGSTTLYNCALLADAEITQRVCHGATVSYVPLGLDAAVNWNTKTDFKFRNNFHFPMMVRAQVSDGYVKMQLLGTDEKDYYVEMEAKGGIGEEFSRAVSYKLKYDKATGKLISREVEAYSTYYPLD